MSGALPVVVSMVAFLVGRAFVDDRMLGRLLWLVAGSASLLRFHAMVQTFPRFPSSDLAWVDSEGYTTLDVRGFNRPFSSFPNSTVSGGKYGGVVGGAESDPGRVPFAAGLPGLIAYGAVVAYGIPRSYRIATRRRDTASLAALTLISITFFRWLNSGYAVDFGPGSPWDGSTGPNGRRRRQRPGRLLLREG